jgi:hypothetical protein
MIWRAAVSSGYAGRLLLLGCLGWLCTLAGCQPTRAPTSDVEEATQLLVQTLDAWKAGKTLPELREPPQSVYVAEELWLQGKPLQDYEVLGPGELFGSNVRFHVALRGVGDGAGKGERQVKYLVTTTPARTIAREDR